jgi:hypothetical protein
MFSFSGTDYFVVPIICSVKILAKKNENMWRSLSLTTWRSLRKKMWKMVKKTVLWHTQVAILLVLSRTIIFDGYNNYVTEMDYIYTNNNVEREVFVHQSIGCPHPKFLRNHWTNSPVCIVLFKNFFIFRCL